MASPESVLVAGAGALGSVVGGLLARAGCPVTLLGRPAHMAAVRANGLAVRGLFGEHHVAGLICATEVRELDRAYDVVLLTVKAWDTAAMAAAVAPNLAPGGMLVCLQNGLGNMERAAAAVGAARVLGGRVIFGAEVPQPGAVRVTVFADPVLIGSPDPADAARVDAAARLATRLDAAGVPARPTATIVADLWGKVFYNAALNPLGALLGLPYGALPEDPDTRAVMDGVLDEAVAVAVADGVTLPWGDVGEYRATFYGRLVPSTAAHRSSMLQDLERGRPTEIDAINGHVVARGAALGVPTPVNGTLARLIRARARLGAKERR